MANPNVSQIGSYILVKAGTVPAAQAAATRDGTAIDRLGYSSCVLFAQSGAVSGAPSTQTMDAKLQDSEDGSTGWADYTPPTGTAAVTQITAASSVSEKDVDLAGAKRYIRVRETVAFTAGTSPTLGAATQVVLGGAVVKPA